MSTQFFAPATVQEAIGLLRRHGPEARPLAGGTDLVVHARSGRAPLPGTLVHLARIPGLNAITLDEAGALCLGALVSHGDVEASETVRRGWTALADASALVGSPATRHMGTVGGNLCNGSPAMEIGGPLLALDATVRLIGPDGQRDLPIDQFFVAPGRTTRTHDELLAGVCVPPLGARGGSAYLRLEYRRAMEIAVVGASAVIALDAAGAVTDCRIALTAVAPRIIRAPAAERSLLGAASAVPELEARLARAGELAAQASAPIDDVRAPRAYRYEMVKVLVVRALHRALQRALERQLDI